MSEFLRRIGYLLSRNRHRRELEAEMQFLREMDERAGRSVRRFGNPMLLQEQAREAWGWTWIDRLIQDLSYAARTLRRSPGFTVTAVLVLALGIGVNVAAFSLFDLAALQSLPVRDPDSLIRLQRRSPEIIAGEMPYATAIFYGEHARSLSAVITMMGARLALAEDAEPVKANFVSANYFSELGATAAYGRLLQASLDGAAGAPLVAVLGHTFWQNHFSADPSIVGKTIVLNDRQVTVVGIVPYGFSALDDQDAEVWMPVSQQPSLVAGSKVLTDRAGGTVRVFARLAPGFTAKMAEQELLTLTNERRKQYPNDVWKGEYIRTDPGGHLRVFEPEMKQAAAIVAALTLLILVIACANLGGLMLARGVAREHEFSIRLAIGANRRRIFRQLLTESLLLAALGAAAGLALAWATLRIVLTVTDAPKWMSAAPDWRVLAFVAGMALLSTLLFGFTPALQMARQRHRKTLARQVLIGAQVAASCLLLIVASLLARAVQHALYTSPGFGYQQVISIDPGLGDHGYKPAAAQVYLESLMGRVRALPGVASVSLVKLPPLGHSISRIDTEANGRSLQIYPNWIEPEFFRTMEIPLLMGRNFLPGEKDAVIVSESLARRQWPGENPLGKRYWDTKTVVGVVGNAPINAMNEDDTVELYQTVQPEDMPDMTLVVKTNGAPEGLTAALKSMSQTLDPKLFPEIRLLKASFRKDMYGLQVAALAVSVIGAVAMLLSAVGILGLVAYTVSQRTKEIAIRMALGAQPGQLLASVLGQFSWPVVLGAVVGIAGTVAASRVLRRVLYGVSNLDPVSYAAAIAILIGIFACAALLPARRALKLDLARALHQE